MSRVDLGEKGVAIIGGGLVGCLLGLYLRKRGYAVHIYEARQDLRKVAEGGRSINLVLTSRGINALTSFSPELASTVMAITIPVFGRTLHAVNGDCTYQPYGPNRSYCNFSVSRTELNVALIDAAERAGCQFYFNHALAHLDVSSATSYYYLRHSDGQLYQLAVKAKHVFGTDGGGSRCRQALKGFLGDACSDRAQPLYYGYKELLMPLKKDGSPAMSTSSLHIWPRGSHFLMALPNLDGSFTMTLYMYEKGDMSFEALDTTAKVSSFFKQYYADALEVMPDAIGEFQRNPVGFLGTVFAEPWIHDDKLLLVGDAAHGITPFFGQGCNAGFEDVFEMDRIISALSHDNNNQIVMKEVFSKVFHARKRNTDAIANMALENFTEMMSKTADKRFLLEKEIEIILAQKFPSSYVSRYALVTHSLIPYDLCKQIGEIQQSILTELSSNISSANQVNLQVAEHLIQQRITPFLHQHRITSDQFLYTSQYYPKANL